MPNPKAPAKPSDKDYDAHCAALEQTHTACNTAFLGLNTFLQRVVTETENKDAPKAVMAFRICILKYSETLKSNFQKIDHSPASFDILLGYLERDIQTILKTLTTKCNIYYHSLPMELIPLIKAIERLIVLSSLKIELSLAARDKLKLQLASLYSFFGSCEFLITNYEIARVFQDLTIDVVKSFSKPAQKEPPAKSLMLLATNIIIFIELLDGKMAWACHELEKIFQAGLHKESTKHYYFNSLAASFGYSKQQDYSNAYRWLERALPFHTDLNYLDWKSQYYGDTEFKPEFDCIETQMEWYYKSHIQAVEELLQANNRLYTFALTPFSLALTLNTSITHWSDAITNQLLQPLNTQAASSDSNIIITSVMDLDIKSLMRLVQTLKALEHAQALKQQKNKESRGLKKIHQALKDITLSTTIEHLPESYVSTSSATVTSTSSSSIHNRRLEKQAKKAARPSSSHPMPPSASEPHQSDAEKLGFSHDLFRDYPFNECRTRGVGSRKIYVVLAESEDVMSGSNTILNLFKAPKIARAHGETGFKWAHKQSGDKDAPPILYGKNPTTKTRIFPGYVESNAQNDLAFRYDLSGVHDTKSGSWKSHVRDHGLPLMTVLKRR